MKKLGFIALIVLASFLFTSCSSSEDIELLDAKVNTLIKEDTGIEDGNGNIVGSIITSEIEYEFVLNMPGLDKGKNLSTYNFIIEPSDELIAVLPKVESEDSIYLKAYGDNPFDENRRTSFGGEGRVGEPNKYYFHLCYEMGRKGTGVEEQSYITFPFPNENEMLKIKENGLEATLIILKNDKEVARFDLSEFNNKESQSPTLQANNEINVNTETIDEKTDDLNFAWRFEKYLEEDESGFDYPYTDLYLVINGETEEEVYIGTYVGYAYQFDDLSNRDIPSEAILACQLYYAGGGDDIYVTISNENIYVKWRPFNEIIEIDEDYIEPKFEIIKTIPIKEEM